MGNKQIIPTTLSMSYEDIENLNAKRLNSGKSWDLV